MASRQFALYTTVYPGVEQYLFAWYQSVQAQVDSDFDVWIGNDGLEIDAVADAMGGNPGAEWVVAGSGGSPAAVRQKAFESLASNYFAVVLVDSDDLLEPTRVKRAKQSLERADVNACSMRLVDEAGDELGVVFSPPTQQDVAELLPRSNVFGLSNSAYRCETLRRCLPIPAGCELVDWFLITRAWALEARLDFDFTCGMAYRQHAANSAPTLPPFASHQVLSAAEKVLRHYEMVFSSMPDLARDYVCKLKSACDCTRRFYDEVSRNEELLDRYVRALNQLPKSHIWWDCVAHPELEHIWRS